MNAKMLEGELREALHDIFSKDGGLFSRSQVGTGVVVSGGQVVSLLGRVRVSNLLLLQYLRDRLLDGNITELIGRRMHSVADIRLDKTCFLENYERNARALEGLTGTQKGVRKEYHKEIERQQKAIASSVPLIDLEGRGDKQETAIVRLDGAGGTGKTHLGIHEILEQLEQLEKALYVARNMALAYYVATLGFHRMSSAQGESRAAKVMAGFCTLVCDEGMAVKACSINRETSEVMFVTVSDEANARDHPSYRLTIVDEAHHVYAYDPSDEHCKTFCERVEGCCKDSRYCILLSDVAQSPEGHYDTIMQRFPPHKSFNLDIVLRSTALLVNASLVSLSQTVVLHCPASLLKVVSCVAY